MTVTSSSRSRARIAVTAAIATVVLLLGGSSAALAHTDFDSSTPADLEAVDGPLGEVVLRFTNAAEPAGDGFELLDPSGAVLTPTSVDPTDGTAFILQFDPALEAGTYGVRWSVRAGDAHPIEGAFQFEVTGSPVVAVPTDTTVPAAAVAADSASAEPAASITTEADASSTSSLDEFLATDSTDDGSTPVGRVGRTLTFLGTIFGVGSLAALVWVIRGRRDELHTQIAWIRLAGIAIAAGGLVELAALQASQSENVYALLDTKPGLAAALKVIGGIIVWVGFHERAGRVVAPMHSLSAAVAVDLDPSMQATIPGSHDTDEHRWSPSASAATGIAGYAVILGSFWFDGHTVSKGPWAFHSLLNLVHVGAAAVWGGGVFAMTTVAWLRRRRAERVGLAAMVVRFSTLATISLSTVIVAGLSMAVLILDSPGELFTTDWGRILIAKTAAVAVAAGMGAYNHFALRPALERSPDNPELLRELRTTLSIESVVFGLVVILTAWLVASAT